MSAKKHLPPPTKFGLCSTTQAKTAGGGIPPVRSATVSQPAGQPKPTILPQRKMAPPPTTFGPESKGAVMAKRADMGGPSKAPAFQAKTVAGLRHLPPPTMFGPESKGAVMAKRADMGGPSKAPAFQAKTAAGLRHLPPPTTFGPESKGAVMAKRADMGGPSKAPAFQAKTAAGLRHLPPPTMFGPESKGAVMAKRADMGGPSKAPAFQAKTAAGLRHLPPPTTFGPESKGAVMAKRADMGGPSKAPAFQTKTAAGLRHLPPALIKGKSRVIQRMEIETESDEPLSGEKYISKIASEDANNIKYVFRDLYRYPNEREIEIVNGLTQDLFKTRELMGSGEVYYLRNLPKIPAGDNKELEKKILGFFDYFRELNLNNNQLGEVWEKARDRVRDKSNPIKAYGRARSILTPLMKANDDLAFLFSLIKPAELHHGSMKSRYPQYALDPKNLWVASRGNSKVKGMHELFHQLGAAGLTNIYNEEYGPYSALMQGWEGYTVVSENFKMPTSSINPFKIVDSQDQDPRFTNLFFLTKTRMREQILDFEEIGQNKKIDTSLLFSIPPVNRDEFSNINNEFPYFYKYG